MPRRQAQFAAREFLCAVRYSAVNRFLNFKFQFQAVVCQPYVSRQGRVGRFVRQIVTDVREKGALRFQPLHDLERVLHGGVRRVRLVPERIQKQDVQIFQLM